MILRRSPVQSSPVRYEAVQTRPADARVRAWVKYTVVSCRTASEPSTRKRAELSERASVPVRERARPAQSSSSSGGSVQYNNTHLMRRRIASKKIKRNNHKDRYQQESYPKLSNMDIFKQPSSPPHNLSGLGLFTLDDAADTFASLHLGGVAPRG